MRSEFAENHTGAHLSEDALDDLLIDAGTEADVAHLASCEGCATRLTSFHSSIAVFNQASSAWSQAKSNSISRELSSRRHGFGILPAWSVAMAFFLAVALSFLVGIHRGMTPQTDLKANAVQRDSDDRQQEIASDNAMLDAIDTEISQPVRSPVEGLEIKKASAPLSRRIGANEERN